MDEAEIREQELHDRRMERQRRETEEHTRLRTENERLRAALQWVGEVYPGRNSSGGAIVHCTWETRYAQWVDLIVRCVAELPDRTSPEDDPTTMLVSEGELRDILWGNLPPAMPTDQS